MFTPTSTSVLDLFNSTPVYGFFLVFFFLPCFVSVRQFRLLQFELLLHSPKWRWWWNDQRMKIKKLKVWQRLQKLNKESRWKNYRSDQFLISDIWFKLVSMMLFYFKIKKYVYIYFHAHLTKPCHWFSFSSDGPLPSVEIHQTRTVFIISIRTKKKENDTDAANR